MGQVLSLLQLCDSEDVRDSEDIREGDDNAAQLSADSSDPIFAPVRKLPTEILAKIFIECIPSLAPDSPPSFDNGMHPQQVRARLGQVCQVWNTILNNEPGVWATLVLDNRLVALEIVSLWIKRSKSHPLDVSLQMHGVYGYKDTNAGYVVKMLHMELWRIRTFFAGYFIDYYNISPLFPHDLSTKAPMMQSLALQSLKISPKGRLGCIHCPQLRTLTLENCDKAVESLISKPMQNLRVLTIFNYRGDNMLYIKLLQALPNLVSLTWRLGKSVLPDEIPRVALPFLKTFAFQSCHWEIMTCLLRHLDIPSLEHLEVGDDHFIVHQGGLNIVLDVVCGDGAVQLRRLTLGDGALRGVNLHAMWSHLKHLETLFISGANNIVSADELFISLSPRNDFGSVCPQLKTLELRHMRISMGALVDFAQRRVKSDLGDPAPGLVTCLKLSDMWVGTGLWVDKEVWIDKEVWVDKAEVCTQLAKTHGSSIYLGTFFVPRH